MAAVTIWERFTARNMVQNSYRAVRAVGATLGLLVGLCFGFGLTHIVGG